MTINLVRQQASSGIQGELPSSNTGLDNATATRLGLMQYLHGGSYNGGGAPTVTSAQSGFSVTRSIFIPYQMNDGTWRLKGNINATFTSASISSFSVSVAGVIFKNISGWNQVIAASINNSASATNECFAVPNTGTLSFAVNTTATSTTQVGFSLDVELDSKPTWAY